jgi:hypothetical protein
MRAQMNPHPTTMNVGLVVLEGSGWYLAGQFATARLDADRLAGSRCCQAS